MSKILFSRMSILKLRKNKNVLNVSEKAITYTDEFKRLFIDEYMSGKLPRTIFMENSSDVDIIGIKRIEQSACRWKAMYKANGSNLSHRRLRKIPRGTLTN